VADLLVLTKTDLASAGQSDALLRRLREINPGADAVRAGRDDGDWLAAPDGRPRDVRRWLQAEAHESHGDTQGHSAHGHGHHHDHDRTRHGDRIRSYVVTRDEPVSWAGVQRWLAMLSTLRGPDLLRVKGIVNVIEHPGRPVVIHGVQHVFHPHSFLPAWPDDDHRTRIVFITRDVERDLVDDTLRIFERRQP